jgi:hypothetical protein
MTEMRHLRCDRCDVDIVVSSARLHTDAERGWVNCRVDLKSYDFCSSCWKEMMTLANVKPE